MSLYSLLHVLSMLYVLAMLYVLSMLYVLDMLWALQITTIYIIFLEIFTVKQKIIYF